MWQVDYNIFVSIANFNSTMVKSLKEFNASIVLPTLIKKIVGLFAIHSLQQETLIKKPMG
jgi:hypothetical protein